MAPQHVARLVGALLGCSGTTSHEGIAADRFEGFVRVVEKNATVRWLLRALLVVLLALLVQFVIAERDGPEHVEIRIFDAPNGGKPERDVFFIHGMDGAESTFSCGRPVSDECFWPVRHRSCPS